MPDTSEVSFDQVVAAYREWIGDSSVPGSLRPRRGRPPKTQRIVVANDLHCPFQSDEAIRGMLRRESRTADGLVLAGDASDSWSFGRWPKHRKLASPLEEFRATQKVLTVLAEAFPWVKVIPGNHDGRLVKWLAAHDVPPEVLDYFSAVAPGACNPLKLMTANLPNVEIVQPPRAGHAEFGFLYQIGDLVIGHPEMYSKIPNKGVGNFIHWLKSFAEPAGIVKPFRVAVQGHTHQAGITSCDYAVWGVENGCLCEYGDYVGDPHCRTPRPWVKGYSVFTLRGRATDINESQFISL